MVKSITRRVKISILHVNTACECGGFLMNKVLMFLRLNGYEVVFDHLDDCDIVLINTCCVTVGMMERSEKTIGRSLRKTVSKKVIIFGCFHVFAKKMKFDSRAVIIGPKEIEKFNDLFAHRIPIERVPAGAVDHRVYHADSGIILKQDYFVLVCQGCLQCCSYCNIKKAKGYVVSRPAVDIINDVRRGLQGGGKDIVLVGDDCGSYGGDLKTDLAVLIKDIFSKCPEARLKIYSIFPSHFMRLFPALRESIADGKIIVINVPIQSGSQRILKLMNRGYDLNRLKKIIKEIRSLAPAVFIKTHIIVNFPTETMEDFRSSMRALQWFDDFDIVNYSKNPLTLASQLPEVEPAEREKRLKICEKMKKEMGCGNIYSD